MTLAPGLYPNIPASDYHADPCQQPSLTASTAKILLNQSPAHARYQHPKLNPDYERKAEEKFEPGIAAHKLLLEGESVIEIIPFDDWRKSDAKLARDEARLAGRIPMLTHQSVEVYAMVNAIAEHLGHMTLRPVPFTAGKPEQTLVWQEGKVTCRARLDWLHDDLSTCDDLKTTSKTARAEKWSERTLYDHGCDIQAAFYLRGLRAVLDADVTWRWVVVETTPPYALSVITPSAPVLAIGEAKVEKALALWRQCLKSGEWPAYSRELHRAELPPWIEARWLEQEAMEEAA